MPNDIKFSMYLHQELNKFLNAESCYFDKKELIERKERIIQVFLIVYGVILSYNWTSGSLKPYLLYSFLVFFAFVMIYYAILPASFDNAEFKTTFRICAKLIALCVSLAFILGFSSFITGLSFLSLLVLVMMFVAFYVVILRLLYV